MEVALAHALEGAAGAREWALVSRIVEELEARRLERGRTSPAHAASTLPTPDVAETAPSDESTPSGVVGPEVSVAAVDAERIAEADASSTEETDRARAPDADSEQPEKPLDLLVAFVRSTKNGLRSERIQERLGMPKEALTLLLKEGLATGQLTATGKARATTYSAV